MANPVDYAPIVNDAHIHRGAFQGSNKSLRKRAPLENNVPLPQQEEAGDYNPRRSFRHRITNEPNNIKDMG